MENMDAFLTLPPPPAVIELCNLQLGQSTTADKLLDKPSPERRDIVCSRPPGPRQSCLCREYHKGRPADGEIEVPNQLVLAAVPDYSAHHEADTLGQPPFPTIRDGEVGTPVAFRDTTRVLASRDGLPRQCMLQHCCGDPGVPKPAQCPYHLQTTMHIQWPRQHIPQDRQ